MISFSTSWQTRHFSCSVPDMTFSIGGTRAKVTISSPRMADGSHIFQEILYPDNNGVITLSDFSSLLEPYAFQFLEFPLVMAVEEQSVTYDEGNVETVTAIDGKTRSTIVVCCLSDINTSCDDFITNHFLSLISGTRQTAPGRMELLSLLGQGTVTVTAYYSDGSSASSAANIVAGNDHFTTVDVSPDRFGVSGKDLVRYVAVCGNRSQEYEMIQDPEPDVAPILLFMNSFGVQELAYCTGEHQQVPVFDRKTTKVGKLKKHYRIEERETFKADTGVMSFAMANWWREVFRSRDVRVVPSLEYVTDGLPVNITAQDAKLSNAADHLPRYTFDYEYAQDNHNVFDVRQEGRIFDNTFDNTFN